MASLGKIAIQIVADISALLTGFNNAQKKMTAFERQMARLDKAVFRFAAGTAAAAAALAALGAKFTIGGALKGLESGAEFVRTAERLGTTTESLGAAKVAAAEVGVNFGRMTYWMQRFAQTLGQAHAGSHLQSVYQQGNAAAKALREMGLNAGEMVSMRLDAAFFKTVQHIAKMPDAAERARAAFMLMGKDGVSALSFIDRLGGNFDEMRKKATQFGFGLTDAEAARLKEGSVAVADMKLAWEGLQFHLAVQLAPVFTAIVSATREWFDSMGGVRKVAEEIAEFLFKSLAVILQMEADASNIIADAGENLGTAAGRVANFFAGMHPLAGVAAGLFDASGGEKGVAAAAANMRKHAADIEGVVDRIVKAMARFKSELAKENKPFGGKDGFFFRVGEQMKFADEVIKQMKTPLERLAELQGLLANNPFIDAQTKNLRLMKEFASLEQSLGTKHIGLASGRASLGSSEAVSVINQASVRPPENAEQRVERVLKEALEYQRLTRIYSEQIARALAGGRVPGAAGGGNGGKPLVGVFVE